MRTHHAVGLFEHGAYDRFAIAQLCEHVEILRTLARIEERDFLFLAGAAEHALRRQRRPDRRLVAFDCFQRKIDLACEVLRCIEIDRDAFGRSEVACQRRFLAQCAIGFGLALELAQARREFYARIRTQHDGAARRCLGRNASDRAGH